jgi:hypothetical protein
VRLGNQAAGRLGGWQRVAWGDARIAPPSLSLPTNAWGCRQYQTPWLLAASVGACLIVGSAARREMRLVASPSRSQRQLPRPTANPSPPSPARQSDLADNLNALMDGGAYPQEVAVFGMEQRLVEAAYLMEMVLLLGQADAMFGDMAEELGTEHLAVKPRGGDAGVGVAKVRWGCGGGLGGGPRAWTWAGSVCTSISLDWWRLQRRPW